MSLSVRILTQCYTKIWPSTIKFDISIWLKDLQDLTYKGDNIRINSSSFDEVNTWMWYDNDVYQDQQCLVDDRPLQVLQQDERVKHELGAFYKHKQWI